MPTNYAAEPGRANAPMPGYHARARLAEIDTDHAVGRALHSDRVNGLWMLAGAAMAEPLRESSLRVASATESYRQLVVELLDDLDQVRAELDNTRVDAERTRDAVRETLGELPADVVEACRAELDRRLAVSGYTPPVLLRDAVRRLVNTSERSAEEIAAAHTDVAASTARAQVLTDALLGYLDTPLPAEPRAVVVVQNGEAALLQQGREIARRLLREGHSPAELLRSPSWHAGFVDVEDDRVGLVVYGDWATGHTIAHLMLTSPIVLDETGVATLPDGWYASFVVGDEVEDSFGRQRAREALALARQVADQVYVERSRAAGDAAGDVGEVLDTGSPRWPNVSDGQSTEGERAGEPDDLAESTPPVPTITHKGYLAGREG